MTLALADDGKTPFKLSTLADDGDDVPEEDLAFDKDDFNAIDLVNQMFPTEESMSGVGPMAVKLKHKIQRVDAEILAAVRHQSTSGSRARSDLTDAMTAIQELFSKIRDIKRKAEQSEAMVHEICRDIKKLDYAKKHLTTTITALRRLSMLVSAVDQLQVVAENRRYRETANLLEAVRELSTHFAAYGQIPRIAELRGKFQTIKASLRTRIFDDFKMMASIQAPDGSIDNEVVAQLTDACLVVDVLEPHVKDELLGNVCNTELSAYTNAFTSTSDMKKLESTERRYHWIKKLLKAKEDTWSIFPATWRVQQLLCVTLCKITRAQLSEILDAQGGEKDVAAVLQALQRTLEFEKELAERFATGEDEDGGPDGEGGGGGEELEDGSAPASSLRKKYERQRTLERRTQGHQAGPSGRQAAGMENAAQAAARTNFRGSISTCFEPHLRSYVELEEKSLLEKVDQLVGEESWASEDGGESGDTAVLGSANQLFLHIKRSLQRCSSLTRSTTLLELCRVFQRALAAYAAKLAARVPAPPGAAPPTEAAAGTSDWHVKFAPGEEGVVARIINTADHCMGTARALGESVARLLDPSLADKVDAEGVDEDFANVVTKAHISLVLGIETRLDAGLVAMTKVNWGQIEAVGDQSDYVGAMNAALSDAMAEAGAVMTEDHFRFLCDKLAASFVPRVYASILRTRRICEEGAQQLLLDVSSIKAFLLEAPGMSEQHAPSASYSRSVQREMARCENLVKVVLSPAAGLADAFRELLPGAPPGDFQRVLEIKGLKRGEAAALAEDLALRGGGAVGPGVGRGAGAGAGAGEGGLGDRLRGVGGFSMPAVNMPKMNMPAVNMKMNLDMSSMGGMGFSGKGASTSAKEMADRASNLARDSKNQFKKFFN